MVRLLLLGLFKGACCKESGQSCDLARIVSERHVVKIYPVDSRIYEDVVDG